MKMAYAKLGLVLVINTVVMFLLTYVLIDSFTHFYANVNRLFMALIMVAPMGALMLFAMRSMFPNKTANAMLYGLFAVIFGFSLYALRAQAPVGNEQFLTSMIPHHSSAIVMCEHSSIDDPEIVELCDQIVESQEREIEEMKRILERY